MLAHDTTEHEWARMSWYARARWVKRHARSDAPMAPCELFRRVPTPLHVRQMPDGWWRVTDGVSHAWALTESGAWSFVHALKRMEAVQ